MSRTVTYRCQEGLCHESCSRIQLSICQLNLSNIFEATYEKLHFRNFLVNLFHELYDEIHQLVLQHLFRVEIRYQERDVISLQLKVRASSQYVFLFPGGQTLTGFLLKIKKASALCVKKRVNLWTRICSISSACLILMLMRTLFILGSISTRSFSFRATVNGFSSTSGEVCASISGTLCRSEVWDAKLERHSAEVREERTHWR
jgi:hypothetical protein